MGNARTEEKDMSLLRRLLIEQCSVASFCHELGWNNKQFEEWAREFLQSHKDRYEYLIRLYSCGNPVYAFGQCDLKTRREFSVRLLDFMTKRCPCLYGDPVRVRSAFSDARIPSVWKLPEITPVVHVFPVYSDWLDEGLMVPLSIEAAEDWHISDAFASLALEGMKTGRTGTAFGALLECIEDIWAALPGNRRRKLPLRWRRAFELQVLIPVHMAAIEGKSLQVPLIVAVLRAFAGTPMVDGVTVELPFGNKPVFSTGVLAKDEDGTFIPVLSVDKKLKGFIREYGEGHTAILTREQVIDLRKRAPELLKKVQVRLANSIRDLLRMNEIRIGLERLCSKPHPTEIDSIILSMERLRSGIRFSEVDSVVEWLRPNLDSPVYRFEVLRIAALMQLHRGRLKEALETCGEAAELVHSKPASYGVDQKIRLASTWAGAAFDACEPELAEPLFVELMSSIGHATAFARTEFYGSLSQLRREAGRWDEAVEAGYKAVHYADMARASEAGQDRNYLVHALIARGRAQSATEAEDFAKAKQLLSEASGPCAPVWDSPPRHSHLAFCRHIEAEIARVAKQPYDIRKIPFAYKGNLEHAVWFAAMACARNESIPLEIQIQCAAHATSRAKERMGNDLLSVYRLLHFVYAAYLACLKGESAKEHADSVLAWCSRLKRKRLPGWWNRLSPHLDGSRQDSLDAVKALCYAIPYH